MSMWRKQIEKRMLATKRPPASTAARLYLMRVILLSLEVADLGTHI